MDYDFVCDTEKLESLGATIQEEKGLLDGYIEEIFKTIDEFETEGIWTGEVYQSFKTYCYTYKDKLELSAKVIENYYHLIDQENVNSKNLITFVGNVNETEE